jgi:SRSO17 transposase
MIEAAADWEPAFAEWLKPFLEALGHKTRQRWAPVYVRGLLGPGERKSVQPMAARVAPADCDQLHHFISSPAWQAAPSSAARPGRPPRSKRCWRARRTASWAGRRRC